MKNIFVKLLNCYGIPKLEYNFNFDNENHKAHLIYAPNGVMKTSFANTMRDICNGNDSEDHFYPERVTERAVKYDDSVGIDLVAKDILVIEPYADSYKSQNISILLADGSLKEEYEKIHREINEKMSKVISDLNGLSGKKNADEILVTDFDFLPENVFECLEKICIEYKEVEVSDYSAIKYGKLFTSDSEKILADSSVIVQLESYIQQYERLMSESTVFEVYFNHNSAEDVLKSLVKEGFFKAEHKLLLAETSTPIDEDEFNKVIIEEKNRILDIELVDEFNKIDELLSSKIGNKALRDYIFENREIIPELIDVKAFKKKIWVSYLFKDLPVFEEAVLNFQNNKKRLEEIARIARTQESRWNEVVLHFNERFSNMPFRLDVANREDVILKSKLPSISFVYKDRGEETNVEEKDLILHLSSGEKKALYLLNTIFEIEARKELGAPTFVVMDDIADSFDYRNKYAIIEYIKDIVDTELFMPVILTHNFDFYRTVAGRVGIKPTSNFVLKSDDEIKLIPGQYFENVFVSWRTNIYTNDRVFISSIAFIRNLVEYNKGTESSAYCNLTSLLHYKQIEIDGAMATEDIKNSDLMDWYSNEWERDVSKFRQDLAQKTIDLIFQTAEAIAINPDETIEIENKIVLSIAIRLITEKYMIGRINDDPVVNEIKGNQTRALRDQISFDRTNKDDLKIHEIIEKVLIITSENIHINSFMYEPIVDMSLGELVNLYLDVKENLNGCLS